jgi:endonuclease-3
MDIKDKIEKVAKLLEKHQGVPELDGPDDPLDCLVRTILSQNTSDTNSGRAFLSLKSRFPEWEDVLEADEMEIAHAIRSGGLSRQKSKVIKDFLRWLRKSRGELSLDFLREMDDEEVISLLTQHRGIGLKTAYIVLAFALGRDAFPVDTHVLRISKRLGFVPQNVTADKAHRLLNPLIPKGKGFSFHVNLIRFGRTICTARNPKCHVCPLRELCDWHRTTVIVPQT